MDSGSIASVLLCLDDQEYVDRFGVKPDRLQLTMLHCPAGYAVKILPYIVPRQTVRLLKYQLSNIPQNSGLLQFYHTAL